MAGLHYLSCILSCSCQAFGFSPLEEPGGYKRDLFCRNQCDPDNPLYSHGENPRARKRVSKRGMDSHQTHCGQRIRFSRSGLAKMPSNSGCKENLLQGTDFEAKREEMKIRTHITEMRTRRRQL